MVAVPPHLGPHRLHAATHEHGVRTHVLVSDRFGDRHVAVQQHPQLVAYLEVLGFERRIALLGAQPHGASQMANLREQGYRLALAEAGVSVREGLAAPTQWFLREDGQRSTRELLESGARPDALFCMNDLLAIGAIHALEAAGLRVPDDVAVVGVDDIEEGRFHRPPLTSIAPDKHEIARLAFENLKARIEGDSRAPSREVTAPYHVEIRESSIVGAASA